MPLALFLLLLGSGALEGLGDLTPTTRRGSGGHSDPRSKTEGSLADTWVHLLLKDSHLLSLLERQVIRVDAIVRVQGHYDVPLFLWI